MENWQTSLLYQVFTNCPLCVHMQAVWQDVPTVGLISILLQDSTTRGSLVPCTDVHKAHVVDSWTSVVQK